MSVLLAVHIVSGVAAILSGMAALSLPKGGRPHRLCGRVFVGAMLVMAALGAGLAAFGPPARSGTPAPASLSVAGLTFYLVTTGWIAGRRRQRGVRTIDRLALVAVLTLGAGLCVFGLADLLTSDGHRSRVVAYAVFACFAFVAAAFDLKLVLAGGVSGRDRIARHLWRMCFALFLASAFFFLGQQQVMPVSLRGSPLLLVPVLIPLAALLFWLYRIAGARRAAGTPEAWRTDS